MYLRVARKFCTPKSSSTPVPGTRYAQGCGFGQQPAHIPRRRFRGDTGDPSCHHAIIPPLHYAAMQAKCPHSGRAGRARGTAYDTAGRKGQTHNCRVSGRAAASDRAFLRHACMSAPPPETTGAGAATPGLRHACMPVPPPPQQARRMRRDLPGRSFPYVSESRLWPAVPTRGRPSVRPHGVAPAALCRRPPYCRVAADGSTGTGEDLNPPVQDSPGWPRLIGRRGSVDRIILTATAHLLPICRYANMTFT